MMMSSRNELSSSSPLPSRIKPSYWLQRALRNFRRWLAYLINHDQFLEFFPCHLILARSTQRRSRSQPAWSALEMLQTLHVSRLLDRLNLKQKFNALEGGLPSYHSHSLLWTCKQGKYRANYHIRLRVAGHGLVSVRSSSLVIDIYGINNDKPAQWTMHASVKSGVNTAVTR